jgi:hypothetical protein
METAESYATTYLEALLRAGLAVPAGDYWCPDGLVLPGDYPDRAEAAGQQPDEEGGGFWLAADLDRPPMVRWHGGYCLLDGQVGRNEESDLPMRPEGVIMFGPPHHPDCWAAIDGCDSILMRLFNDHFPALATRLAFGHDHYQRRDGCRRAGRKGCACRREAPRGGRRVVPDHQGSPGDGRQFAWHHRG